MDNPFAITNTPRAASKKRQFIGVHLDQELADYLSLYAMWRGVAKQIILQEIVESFVKREVSADEIIGILSSRALSAWHTMWRENTGKRGWQTDEDEERHQEEFRAKLKKTLAIRGVAKGHIDRILQPLLIDKAMGA
jgi:hypothetical protein